MAKQFEWVSMEKREEFAKIHGSTPNKFDIEGDKIQFHHNGGVAWEVPCVEWPAFVCPAKKRVVKELPVAIFHRDANTRCFATPDGRTVLIHDAANSIMFRGYKWADGIMTWSLGDYWERKSKAPGTIGNLDIPVSVLWQVEE